MADSNSCQYLGPQHWLSQHYDHQPWDVHRRFQKVCEALFIYRFKPELNRNPGYQLTPVCIEQPTVIQTFSDSALTLHIIDRGSRMAAASSEQHFHKYLWVKKISFHYSKLFTERMEKAKKFSPWQGYGFKLYPCAPCQYRLPVTDRSIHTWKHIKLKNLGTMEQTFLLVAGLVQTLPHNLWCFPKLAFLLENTCV